MSQQSESASASQEPLLPYHGNINYVPRPPDSQHSTQLLEVDDVDKQQFIDFTKQANQLLDDNAQIVSNPVQTSSQDLDIPSQFSLDPDFLPPIARPSSPIRYDSQSQVLLDSLNHDTPSTVPQPPQVLQSLDQERISNSPKPIHTPLPPSQLPPLVKSSSGVPRPVVWDSPSIKQSFPFHPGVAVFGQPPVQQPHYAFGRPPTPNLLHVAPSKAMKPLVPKRDEMRTKRQCTSTGKPMYESSELYSVNPTPSLEVLRSMKGLVTQCRDTENRMYYNAQEHEFNAEWVKDKMSQLTINSQTDSLWWLRADSHESKGMFMKPWPSVGSVIALLVDDDDDGQKHYYQVVENSDGQVERKARARNTGYVILRKVT